MTKENKYNETLNIFLSLCDAYKPENEGNLSLQLAMGKKLYSIVNTNPTVIKGLVKELEDYNQYLTSIIVNRGYNPDVVCSELATFIPKTKVLVKTR